MTAVAAAVAVGMLFGAIGFEYERARYPEGCLNGKGITGQP